MVTIRAAVEGDLQAVAQVHMRCFPDYFLTKLGERLLEAYYREFFEEDGPFVVAEESGSLVGFCMGYEPGSQARQRFMTRYQRQLIGKSLGMMLRLDTGIYSRVWSYVKSKFKKSPPAPETPVHGPDGRGDLLSICVLEGYLGRGVSAALLQQFEAQLVQRGISQYTLSVNRENARARAFYEKSGMHAESASGGSVIYSKAIKL